MRTATDDQHERMAICEQCIQTVFVRVFVSASSAFGKGSQVLARASARCENIVELFIANSCI